MSSTKSVIATAKIPSLKFSSRDFNGASNRVNTLISGIGLDFGLGRADYDLA
jgi:hypothetical protein